MANLFAFRPWLRIEEAAAYLTEKLGHPVSPADVLRLALDGHIGLALNLPTGTVGDVRRADDWQSIAVLKEPVDGVWDLPLEDAARRQVEHEHHWLAHLPFISMQRTKGVVVVRHNLRCELPPDRGAGGMSTRPESAFPQGSVLVIRTAVLDAFAATVPPRPLEPAGEDPDKPLATRERTTLLVIIAALCRHAKIDFSKPSAAGVAIEALTQEVNARVSARRIEDYLRSIPDALDRRGKLSS